MKLKNLIFSVALILAICLSAGRGLIGSASGSSPSPDTGMAAVHGVVKFVGAPPRTKPINMAADAICAKQHPGAMPAQDFIADAQGDLQNAVVFIADGLDGRNYDAPSQPAILEQKGCLYEPHVFALQARQPLQVINDDSTMHNIHPVPSNNREWNVAQGPGSKVEEGFPREELGIVVKCNIHPWMRSYISVFKHPFFGVTAKNGVFDLRNLPPGTYTIEAWHEKLGTSIQKITIGANETKHVEFVFKSVSGS
jgi:hypothetical protein